MFEPRVPERAPRVEPLGEQDEVGQAFVEGRDLRGARKEELAPVRARREGSKRRLQLGEDALHHLRLALPREVEGDRIDAVLRAEPEPIGCDRSNQRIRSEAISAEFRRAYFARTSTSRSSVELTWNVVW